MTGVGAGLPMCGGRESLAVCGWRESGCSPNGPDDEREAGASRRLAGGREGSMKTRKLETVLAGAALALAASVWAPTVAGAQQGMGPSGQSRMGSGGMMTTQAAPPAATPGREQSAPGTGGGRLARPAYRANLYERPLVSEMLAEQDALGLAPDQVQRLQALRTNFEKQAVELQANIQVAQVDLNDLLGASRPDMGKVEAQIQKIASLRAQLQIARIKALDSGRAVLSQEQWQKFAAMTPAWGPRARRGEWAERGYGMGPGTMGGYGRGMHGSGMMGYGPYGMMGGCGPWMHGGGRMGYGSYGPMGGRAWQHHAGSEHRGEREQV